MIVNSIGFCYYSRTIMYSINRCLEIRYPSISVGHIDGFYIVRRVACLWYQEDITADVVILIIYHSYHLTLSEYTVIIISVRLVVFISWGHTMEKNNYLHGYNNIITIPFGIIPMNIEYFYFYTKCLGFYVIRRFL